MIYIIIGVVIVIIVIVLIVKKKEPEVIIPHEIEETSLDNDICKIIKDSEITPNKSLILGVDKGLVIFEDDQVVYQEENYSVNYDSIVGFFEKPVPSKNDEIDKDTSENIMTCYKVRKGLIKDIEAELQNSNHYFDNFYNVLIQLVVSLRATYQIIDYSIFLKDVVFFTNSYPLKSFEAMINKVIEPKVYASISSYVQQNEISYLHISLYKHEIEERVIDDLNDFLSTLGIKVTRLTFTDIANIEDTYFQKLSKSILEKSKMNIIDYTYEDKMNNDLGIIEDEIDNQNIFKETKVFVKD